MSLVLSVMQGTTIKPLVQRLKVKHHDKHKPSMNEKVAMRVSFDMLTLHVNRLGCITVSHVVELHMCALACV
jgi:hypothetical protein